MRYILFTAILINMTCAVSTPAQDDNPFVRMIGKPYTDYFAEWYHEYWKFGHGDTAAVNLTYRNMQEAARQTGSPEWKLYAELWEINCLAYNAHPFDFFARMNDLIKKSQKAGITHLALIIRAQLIRLIWSDLKDYELAFELSGIQNRQLQTLSPDILPLWASHYLQIGDMYIFFRDYAHALPYYQNVASLDETEYNQWARSGALNGLGLCYRLGFDDLDRSDSCFQAILNVEKYIAPRAEADRDLWDGIAEGNLGVNSVLRGDCDRAIPLLKSSIEKMAVLHDDYAYASGPATRLAGIYLQQGNLPEAKRYLDDAFRYYALLPRESNLPLLYETAGKYYAAMGDAGRGMAYMDSTLAVNQRLREEFDALLLKRVEQRRHIAEQRLKDEQLHGYRRTLFIVAAALLLITLTLVLYYILYRKKKAAYRELVSKAQEWANVETPLVIARPRIVPDEIDLSIMNSVETLMIEEKIYTDPALTVGDVALRLDVKTHYVSIAVNTCTKRKFNTYVNEYRIREAIRIMSDKTKDTTSIDDIAMQSGFSDRTNFYRVFKKITGLPPSEFRKTLIK